MDTVDDERADFIKKYFNEDWPSRRLYHMMINSQIGDEAVVRTILNGISTRVEVGTFLAIVGPNGSGKSSLARALGWDLAGVGGIGAH